MTLDRYGHLFPDELQRLAERLQEAYGDTVTDPARTEPRRRSLWNAKRQVGDLPLLVEVGRVELPCLVIHVYRRHAAPMAESGR